MVFPVKLIDFVNSVVYVERRSVFAEYIFTLDEVELMQFTGLRDKNGKEIYEGDIIKIDDSNYRLPGISVVEWWNGQFVFDAQRRLDDDYINFGWWVRSNNGMPQLKQIEVLGNIYENPDLLGGESTCT
jgi:uncharacterized phage protein (TIGR01671 family)